MLFLRPESVTKRTILPFILSVVEGGISLGGQVLCELAKSPGHFALCQRMPHCYIMYTAIIERFRCKSLVTSGQRQLPFKSEGGGDWR